jgi:AcrR family transcriptional regulator
MTSAAVEPVPAARRTRLTKERAGELFEAVLGLVREVGYEAMTMDAVAARAHSSKATLYRQWGGKPQLVASALNHHRVGKLVTTDTGSLRGDLLEHAASMVDACDRDAPLVAGLAHAVLSDPELSAAVREIVIGPAHASFTEIVQRAVQRGEIPLNPAAAEFCPQAMVGLALMRDLHEGLPADRDYLTRVVDTLILPALKAA